MNEIKPNFVDRLVGFFSPVKMAERLQTRAYLASPEFKSSYRGGIPSRLDRTSSRSNSIRWGTAGELNDLRNLRDRGRRVYDQSNIGRAIIDTETDYAIGDGMTLQARTKSEPFNKEAEERFRDWLEIAEITGKYGACDLQRMAFSTSRIDGDGGMVFVDRGGESKVQLIPADRVQTPDGKIGPNIVDGIEVNAVGRPVRFHVLIEDGWGTRKFESVTADNFKFLAWGTKPMEVRGVTAYAQVFSQLDQLDGYVDALVIAARMGCVFGLIFKEATGQKQFGALGSRINGSGESQKAITLENGMVKYIGKEDDVVQVQASQPMSQSSAFITDMLRLIGLPFGMPLEIIGKDASKANLSALRGIKQDYYRSVKPKQRRFVGTYMAPMYRWWISREVNRGTFTTAAPEDFWAHEWMPAKIEFTDPITQAQALLLEIDMGLTSPQRACAELGRDHEVIRQELLSWIKGLRSDGLPEIRSTFTRDSMAAKPVEEPPKQLTGENEDEPEDTEETDDGQETEQA